MAKSKSKAVKKPIVESDSEIENVPLKRPDASSSSEEESAPSNVILRAKIDKKLLNNKNKTTLTFSDDSDSEDVSNVKLTVNKAFEKKFEKKQTATALSKENQRILSQLQRQVEREERDDLRQERKAKKMAKLEEAAIRGIEYVSDEDDWSSSADEYSSEDDDGKKITPEVDAKIFETLVSLRKKDPKIYNKDVAFFENSSSSDSGSNSDSSDSEAEAAKKAKKAKKEQQAKKVTLGKFMAQQAEKGEALEADSDDERPDTRAESFYEEQERIKREFFDSLKQEEAELKSKKSASKTKSKSNILGGSDSDGDDEDSGDEVFGTSKRVWDPTFDPDSDEEVEALAKKASEYATKLDGDSGTNGSSFLENYLLNSWWKAKDAAEVPSATELLGKARSRAINLGGDIEAEDDEADEAADRFEAHYNFRFLEPGAEEIASYPRAHMIDESLRKKDDSRRDARLRKAERQKLERQQKLEEIKRLKNVKRQALMERVKAISLVAGININGDVDDEDLDEDLEKPDFGGDSDEERELAALKKQFAQAEKKGKKGKKGSGLTEKDLTGDFDPEEHDRLMAKLFDAEFYDALGDDDVDKEEEDLRNDDAVDLLEKVTTGVDDEGGAMPRPRLLAKEKSKDKKSPAVVEEVDETAVPAGLVLPEELETDDSDLDDEERKERRDLRVKYIKQHKVVSTSIQRQRDNSAQTIKKSLQSMFETGNDKETEAWWRVEKERILANTEISEEIKSLPVKDREAAIQALLATEMEKLDELDKEDVLAGTRFRYRQVKPASYGMDILDILNADEKELSRRVNMKRLAPYRDDDEDMDWRELQKDQRDKYKEFMQKHSSSGANPPNKYNKRPQESISTSRYHINKTQDEEDVVEQHKVYRQTAGKGAKGQYSHDISQGNRPWTKDKVTSVSWYKSRNNFTIPQVKQNKHIKFDGDNIADAISKKSDLPKKQKTTQ